MFKDRLRYTRESRDISQIEMAKRLDIAVTTYRNYENTSREPNYEILVNISKTLNVSIDYLLENDGMCSSVSSIVTKAEKLSERSLNELNSYVDYLMYKDERSKQKFII